VTTDIAAAARSRTMTPLTTTVIPADPYGFRWTIKAGKKTLREGFAATDGEAREAVDRVLRDIRENPALADEADT
jgi:hypothetical protein